MRALRWARGRPATFWLGLFVVALTLAGGAQGYVQDRRTADLADQTAELSRRNADVSRCLSAYAVGFADALEARSAATQGYEDSLDALFDAIAGAPQTEQGREMSRRAFDDYRASRAKVREKRRDHPFPAAPRGLCER